MPLKPINVLFLCTHNSARSILSEALLNHLGTRDGVTRFQAFSAGSSPRENQRPHPMGLQVLAEAGISTHGLSSKSWDVFAQADAPQMDLIITVCNNAAGEACPFWPGRPASAHWGYADPSAGNGSEAEQHAAFTYTLQLIRQRLQLLVNLPEDKLNALSLQKTARELAQP